MLFKRKNNTCSMTSLALKFLMGMIVFGISVHQMTANAENVLLRAPVLSYPVAFLIKVPTSVFIANEDKVDLRKLLFSRAHYQNGEINLEIGLHQIGLNSVNSRSIEISRKLRTQDTTSIALILPSYQI